MPILTYYLGLGRLVQDDHPMASKNIQKHNNNNINVEHQQSVFLYDIWLNFLSVEKITSRKMVGHPQSLTENTKKNNNNLTETKENQEKFSIQLRNGVNNRFFWRHVMLCKFSSDLKLSSLNVRKTKIKSPNSINRILLNIYTNK